MKIYLQRKKKLANRLASRQKKVLIVLSILYV